MEGNLQQPAPAFRRLIGLELSGPHSERSALVVLDEYPQSERLVVTQAVVGLGATADKTSDQNLCDLIEELSIPGDGGVFVGLATQAPLNMPPFFKDAEARSKEERWLFDLWNRTKPKPRQFLPYLNRPLDAWMRYFTPERFQVPEAMGANFAPLLARMQALGPSLPAPLFECYPRASMTRIVGSASMNRAWPKLYTDTERGIQVREEFLTRFLQLCPQIFVYEGDLETLIVDISSFQAFLSALSLFLHHKNQCDPRPETFPSSASWLVLPRQKIRWNEAFKEPASSPEQ